MRPAPAFTRSTGAALIGLLLAGCAGGPQPAVFTSTPAPEERDEHQLWHQAAAEQARLDTSGFVVSLPEAEAYFNGVLRRLNVPGATGASDAPVRVRIVVDPTLNAFAMPHGALYLHTGLLVRLEDEAQLATILAHEAAHVTHRHGVRQWRQLKTSTAWMASLTVGTGGYAALLGLFGGAAAVTGYSRELEREADVEGFQRLQAAGYDATRAPKVFQILQAESARSKLKEPFFFGSHPKLQERIDNFSQLVARLPEAQSGGRTAEKDFAVHLPPILQLDADAAMRVGDFDGAAATLDRFEALAPDHPELASLRGEWHRKRGADGDLDRALTSYQRALDLAADHPVALRGRGLVLAAAGRKDEAAADLRRYLEVAPSAPDRHHILHLLATWSPHP